MTACRVGYPEVRKACFRALRSKMMRSATTPSATEPQVDEEISLARQISQDEREFALKDEVEHVRATSSYGNWESDTR